MQRTTTQIITLYTKTYFTTSSIADLVTYISMRLNTVYIKTKPKEICSNMAQDLVERFKIEI